MKQIELPQVPCRGSVAVVTEMTKTALLSPDETVRIASIRSLDALFEHELMSIYTGDDQLFLNVSYRGETYIIYVCDMPKNIFGQENPRAYNFKMPKR
jgi:hypothetical protein